jgi:hypothetical protein
VAHGDAKPKPGLGWANTGKNIPKSEAVSRIIRS